MKKIIYNLFFVFGLFIFVFLFDSVNIAALDSSWGYEKTNMTMFLNKTAKAKKDGEVIVAVVGTGVDTTHTWFASDERIQNYGGAYCNDTGCAKGNYSDFGKEPVGTHVAGIITKATSSNVKILPIRIEKGDQGYNHDALLKALEYLEDLINNENFNIKVISLAISSDEILPNDRLFTLSDIEDKIDDFYEQGVFVVVGAKKGDNQGDSNSIMSLQNAIVVSSLNENMELTGDSYSDEIDFAAPGVNVISSIPGGTDAMSGTVVAAAHVAADIALLYDACSSCTIYQINSAISAAATPLSENEDYGIVYLDMAKAHEDLVDSKEIKITYYGKGTIYISVYSSDCYRNAGYVSSQYTKQTLMRKGEHSFTITPRLLWRVKHIKVNGEVLVEGKLFGGDSNWKSENYYGQINVEFRFSFLFF